MGFHVDGIQLESVDDLVHDGINLRCQLYSRRVLENLVAAVHSTSSIDMDGFRALKYVVAVTSGCSAIFVSFG